MSIEKLSELNNNLNNLLLSSHNYVNLLDNQGIKKCLLEFNLKEHIAIMFYLTDYIQQKSLKFLPAKTLGYNALKKIFEEKSANSLGRLIEKSDNLLSETEIRNAMEQYFEIYPGLKNVSLQSFETHINELIHQNGLDQYKIRIK